MGFFSSGLVYLGFPILTTTLAFAMLAHDINRDSVMLSCLALIIFGSLAIEVIKPCRLYRNKRPYKSDTLYTFLNLLLGSKLGDLFFISLFLYIKSILFKPNTPISSDFWGPIWLQFILITLIFEFFRYVMHYFQHKVPILWKLHAIHHNVPEIYSLNTFYSHPVDYLLRNVPGLSLIVVLGFDPLAIIAVSVFLATIGISSHSGANYTFKKMNYLFITNIVHRWHHTSDENQFNKNFGVSITLYDHIFRTFYLPKDHSSPVQLGLSKNCKLPPKKFWKILLLPFYDR